jgi:DNA-binding NtrC family response regulator
VRGDSGTGKEVAASAIHRLSGRKGPFLAVNCGAIPTALVESELFGSRKGAFSGAENRPGLVRNADGGTLFLDEVAELPLASQVALLRVLQEGEVLPLGEGKPTNVDVRVVAATHQPLEKLLDKGLLRRDLVARLRGYELRLPPLRERREDLGLLIATLLARIEAPARRFTRPAARALFAHAWPFNIRELEQTLRAAVAIAEGEAIDVADLRLGTFEADAPKERERPDERARLVAALEKHGGNVSAVARAFATSRTQVQRMLARHALDPTDFARR